jgi:hypothetical protein
MASASTSCSVRSEKFFTYNPFGRWRAGRSLY